MSPKKAKRAVHGRHCLGDIAVCMRKVLFIPQSWCSVPPVAYGLTNDVIELDDASETSRPR